MRAGYGLLLLVACSSSGSWSTGDEATAKVQRVLESPPEEFSALLMDGVVYGIPPERLASEKKALFDALRAAPFSSIRSLDDIGDLEVNTGRPGERSEQRPIVAWTKSDVFELVHRDGSLQISRSAFLRGPQVYGVSLVKGRDVLYGGAKSGRAIDAAWRRLAQAARARTFVWIDKGVESPLNYAREVGIDFRGIEEE